MYLYIEAINDHEQSTKRTQIYTQKNAKVKIKKSSFRPSFLPKVDFRMSAQNGKRAS